MSRRTPGGVNASGIQVTTWRSGSEGSPCPGHHRGRTLRCGTRRRDGPNSGSSRASSCSPSRSVADRARRRRSPCARRPSLGASPSRPSGGAGGAACACRAVSRCPFAPSAPVAPRRLHGSSRPAWAVSRGASRRTAVSRRASSKSAPRATMYHPESVPSCVMTANVEPSSNAVRKC